MNGSRFDGWTRRQVGLATGALAAALGFAAVDDAVAKRKRRRKRCRKLHQTCTLESNRKRCCKPLRCQDETFDPDIGSCCRPVQTPCESENQCCLAFECQEAVGLPGKRCCSPFGVFCREIGDCCASEGVICDDLNNCCRRVQASCAADDECCGDLFCKNVPALGGLRCCAEEGDPCEVMNDCCSGMGCQDGTCGD